MHEHILVVDDEKEIADLLEVYLKNDGYTVHKFYNGCNAVQTVSPMNCCAAWAQDCRVWRRAKHKKVQTN